jgi:hypothetical protein
LLQMSLNQFAGTVAEVIGTNKEIYCRIVITYDATANSERSNTIKIPVDVKIAVGFVICHHRPFVTIKDV